MNAMLEPSLSDCKLRDSEAELVSRAQALFTSNHLVHFDPLTVAILNPVGGVAGGERGKEREWKAFEMD